MASSDSDRQPQVEVEQASEAEKLGEGLWATTFRVVNATDAPVSLQAAWLPHGKFRCSEQSLAERAPVPPGGATHLTFQATFDESPGTAVENAFVILRVLWRDGLWRILARVTVTAGDDGAPQAKTVLISVHPVGFSR